MKGTFKVLLLVSIAVAVGVGTVLATSTADDIYGLLWVRDLTGGTPEDGDIRADGQLEIYGLRAKIGLDSANNGARLLFGTPENYQEEKLVALDDYENHTYIGLNAQSIGLQGRHNDGQSIKNVAKIELNVGGSGDVVITLGED